ncbi:MAG: glycosyl hydrolase family 43, partial [Clostridia bacterium]|nr:glycosyl hydrolase family 43 [Clostridia bacterium]
FLLYNIYLYLDKNRLYFSAGLTFIDDCGFSEPTYISYAESDGLTSGFSAIDTPVLSPDEKCEYLNICCGCIKVYQLKDCYIAFQNGIFKGSDGKSHSAIVLLKSQDGKKFEFVRYFLTPQVCDNLEKHKDWMQQYVYACSLAYYDGQLNLYFNARDISNPILGHEHIGLYRAKI